MAMTLTIPDSIAQGLRLPVQEIEPRLRSELALSLYAQNILSFGKASELAEISRYAFAELAVARNIPRHYGDDDLTLDLAYAGRQ